MRRAPTKRAESKRESQERILDAAARRLREEGLNGAGIAAVMRDAGLTHGAFYSHFSTKDELASAAFGHAIGTGRPHWIKASHGESWRARLTTLAKRYLTPAHRDDLATSCAFAALGSEAARGSEEFRGSYERELRTSLAAICGDDADDQRFDEAIALMALCVGGMTLSRAVADPQFSARILRSAQAAAAKIAADQPHRGGSHGRH
ncbi:MULTISPECIES: TetR/AcrR family transcriptional regulator [unclassified Mycolicibacterium]|uniref:TetR/AcrR family transcriptional regulator n=1 Tax=unclassified Mycolicibacterium TaxID=2636767 RepID=UPI002EDB1153